MIVLFKLEIRTTCIDTFYAVSKLGVTNRNNCPKVNLQDVCNKTSFRRKLMIIWINGQLTPVTYYVVFGDNFFIGKIRSLSS